MHTVLSKEVATDPQHYWLTSRTCLFISCHSLLISDAFLFISFSLEEKQARHSPKTMSSLLPSSSNPLNGNLAAANGTLQRSAVNNAAADALRKKMQQLRDELELVKDDLERARKEYEKERHAREIVSFHY